jgi:hypothetical protein
VSDTWGLAKVVRKVEFKLLQIITAEAFLWRSTARVRAPT